jgi:arylsulfatase A-like enzyme
VTVAALDWLDRRSSPRPFLLYLHTADPHGPYLPPPEFRTQVGSPEQSNDLGSLATLQLLHEEKLPVDAALIRSVRSLYDAEVAENDQEFGRVLGGLRARRLYDDALVVFVADHGEEFYEHRGWQHGHTLYGELLHIPLVVKFPGGEHAGTRVDKTVQLVDVLPTLLEYGAGDESSTLPGTSLRRAWGDGPARAAFAHLDLDGRTGDAVVAGRWKLIAMAEGSRLFDREDDPTEQHDVADEHPITVGYLRTLLAERVAAGPSPLPARNAVLTDEVRRNLKALGYVR